MNSGPRNMAILIPAYNPDRALVDIARDLSASGIGPIIVVNDGSASHAIPVFEALKEISGITVLKHSINMGKGAALKTGMDHIYSSFTGCQGIVTVDADGQHLSSDVIAVCDRFLKEPRNMVLGTREFSRDVPLRSRFGNKLTRFIIRTFFRLSVSDTQTGLRAFPMTMVPGLLDVPYSGYDFEMEMLIKSEKFGVKIVEQPIRTVYLEDNRSSHFNPFLDSIKIYFVLARFLFASLITTSVDFIVFLLAYSSFSSIIISTYAARTVALTLNFILVRKMVFHSKKGLLVTFVQYVLLVMVLGFIVTIMINFFHNVMGLGLIASKILSETLLYIANFSIQRNLIFGSEEKRTDWDIYYKKPYKTATYTRKMVSQRLIRAMQRHIDQDSPVIAELGGANSSFYDSVMKQILPSQYHVIDNNSLGLNRFSERIGMDKRTIMHESSVLDIPMDIKADVAFSIGLIEHFSGKDVIKAIDAHFDILRPGGLAILSFPTPTLLYRATRFISEVLGMWIFHDEVPLRFDEVKKHLEKHGQVLEMQIIWPMVLTQCMVSVRKYDS